MGGFGKLDGDDGGNDAEDFLFLFFFLVIIERGERQRSFGFAALQSSGEFLLQPAVGT